MLLTVAGRSRGEDGQEGRWVVTRRRPGGRNTSDLAGHEPCAAVWTEGPLCWCLFRFFFYMCRCVLCVACVCARSCVCRCMSTCCREAEVGTGSLLQLSSISFAETRLNKELVGSDGLASQLALESPVSASETDQSPYPPGIRYASPRACPPSHVSP